MLASRSAMAGDSLSVESCVLLVKSHCRLSTCSQFVQYKLSFSNFFIIYYYYFFLGGGGVRGQIESTLGAIYILCLASCPSLLYIMCSKTRCNFSTSHRVMGLI